MRDPSSYLTKRKEKVIPSFWLVPLGPSVLSMLEALLVTVVKATERAVEKLLQRIDRGPTKIEVKQIHASETDFEEPKAPKEKTSAKGEPELNDMDGLGQLDSKKPLFGLPQVPESKQSHLTELFFGC